MEDDKREKSQGEVKKEGGKEKVILIPARLFDIIKELCKDDNKMTQAKIIQILYAYFDLGWFFDILKILEKEGSVSFNFSQKEIAETLEKEFMLIKN
ncbi:MAG: hypothetical protein Pg6B_06860 [Candidatus Azobacteroides pseudotrichonymphae]|jgi:hypothetical protein|uniref:hypothetical protein n=1 Tax=Candidatus Azobacteroides pseudotrichonymphae TaxID=511435 RepID=UPI0002F72FDF|nr:hypothetical protein [Candidatus Azobacteroides pseudotrichonymphae]MDR0530330.1 hypothetical protein [Bacteroidales bacterium OttesenSCG-928-I14]GMO35895.1 MAG: hypothetical protein Pg6B_06860 [Candidatus Azobacteroides pseudotrichonymphae]